MDNNGDRPSAYARSVARALWTEDELKQGMISPARENEARRPMSPTRTNLFRGKPEFSKLAPTTKTFSSIIYTFNRTMLFV